MRDLARRLARLEKDRPATEIVLLFQDAETEAIRHESGLTFATEGAAQKHFSGAHVILIQFV